ncbi:MAG: pilus assembly protein N-terminal domain-containing protein [Gemmatimonadaceae bacterium]|nr:pilus assembly protein N-terminal domain-containing protein [Gemmatimonadaceae bacterium]
MRTTMSAPRRGQLVRLWQVLALLLFFLLLLASRAIAQSPVSSDTILRISLSVGRSLPLTTPDPITRVAVANPEIADVVVLGERDLVINGKANGETDIVLWAANRPRLHYRVSVRAPNDRRMVLLAVRLAEVRKDVLRQIGVSGLHKNDGRNTRVGTGLFKSDNAIDPEKGTITIPGETRFLTILSDFGTKQFLALLEAEEQGGRARLLAEPNLLAADRDSASFLAGGELPIPIVQGAAMGAGQGGQGFVTITYREFGVRLRFSPDIVSDSLIKLFVRPEVSSLDYGNAVTLNGFRIPALRTRRVESTVDIRRDQSVVLSGLFNEERERVRTGVPWLMNVPVLGALFSSSRWQNAESELLVIITPSIIDPANVGAELLAQPRTPGSLPAIEALRKRPASDTSKRQ